MEALLNYNHLTKREPTGELLMLVYSGIYMFDRL